jgi:hypothetical protein
MSTDAEEDKITTAIREMGAMDGIQSTTQGCPVMPPDQPYNPDDSLEYAVKAAKAMGMDQTCVDVAKNISDKTFKSDSASGAMVIVTPMGGGGGGFQSSSNETNTFTDTTMTTSGCQKISNTMNQMKMEEVSMTCNMNKTLSELSGSAIGSNNLLIELMDPSGPAAALISQRIQELNGNLLKASAAVATASNTDNETDVISRIAMANPPISDAMAELAYDAINSLLQKKLDALTAVVDMNRQALDDYQAGNPLNSSIIDSNIVQEINSKMKLASKQDIDVTAKTVMKQSMSRLATSVALDQINTDIGPGGARDAAREMVTNQVEKKMVDENTNIEETITKNSMTVESGNNVVLRMKGDLIGTDISQSITSQVSVTVQQSIKKSVEIGKEVATQIITETVETNIEDRTSGGIDRIVAAASANDADLIAANKAEGLGDIMQKTGEGIGSAAEGIGSGIGNAAEGVGGGVGKAAEGVGKGVGSALGGAMIPFIIIGVLLIGGFFLFPKLIPQIAAMSGMSPTMIKIAGGVAVAVIVGLIVFFYIVPAFSGGSKESRRRPAVNDKYYIRAPAQRMLPVNTQAIQSPHVRVESRNFKDNRYARVEPRNFKGDRSARKIPSYKKINNYFRSPTERVHNTKYTINKESMNISTVHNPSYHFQNKVEDKAVMYSKKSAYKNNL